MRRGVLPCLLWCLLACKPLTKQSRTLEDSPTFLLDPKPHYVNEEMSAYHHGIMDLLYVPTNPNLVFILTESKIVLFDISSSQFVWDRMSPTSQFGNSIFDGPIRVAPFGDVAVSPNGSTVAIGFVEGRMALVSSSSGDTILKKVVVTKPGESVHHAKAIQAVEFSPDGKRVLATSPNYGEVLVLAADTLETVATLKGARGQLDEVGTSKDGRYVFAAGTHGIFVWELSSKKLLKSFGQITHLFRRVRFSSDLSYALSTQGNDIVLYDVQNGNEIQRFKGHTNLVSDIAFLPDHSEIVSVSGDINGDQSIRVWNVATGKELQKVSIASYSRFITRAVQVSPDKQSVTVGTADRLLVYKLRAR